MTYIRWLLHSLMVYSTVPSIYSFQHHPLIFNSRTREIYTSNESDCTPCAVACPARSQTEKKLERTDFHYKSLFVQEVIDSIHGQNASGLKCKHAYELTVLLHSKKGGRRVEFGFEVYFKKSEFQSEQISSQNYYKFSPVANGELMFERLSAWKKKYLALPWSRRKSTIKKWGFVWLSKIEVRYNFSSRMLTSLQYKVRPIRRDQLKLTCHDHNLHGIWYNRNEELNPHYDNQSEIFTKVKIPEGSCRPNNRDGDCFKKHNLVLPYQFQAESPDKISCSNLTSIPLWNKIPDVFMDRVQLFLIAIARVLGDEHELIVLPGVLGQLTLPSIEDDKPIKIYLDAEHRKIPVPKTIYILVRYRSYKCDEKNGELCWFDVLVVIHNYATFATDERLCPIDECDRLGWDSIQYLNSKEEEKLAFVYCCELTKVVANSIGFPLGKTSNELLNLKVFIGYDYILRRHESLHIFNDILVEFKKLVDAKGGGVESRSKSPLRRHTLMDRFAENR